MKKFLILLFLLFFLGIDVKADSSNSLVSYYSNLDNNFSYNPNNSCTFVSTTMLLSYYDTFLNDDIIPEKYDVASESLLESPGVLYESITSTDDDIYSQELIAMKEYSLQGLLFDISNKLGFGYSSITNSNREAVLRYYFSNYTPLQYGIDYTFSYTILNDSLNDLAIMKNEIDNSRPVIINYDFQEVDDTGKGLQRLGHSAIAYSYNESAIYCHIGDKEFANYQYNNVLSNDFFILKEVFSINFNINHKHSNNYAVDDDEYNHIICCPCGYQSTELHNTIATSDNRICCSKCDKNFTNEENFEILLDPSANSLCGTYVNIYGGDFNSNDVIKGYTRIAYIIGGTENSRLNYNWYSSNQNVCEVTKYGTILAKNEGTAFIIASSKTEPFKYSRIEINVLNDYNNTLKYISVTTDIREPYSLNGTEVTLNNGNPNEYTIHSGYTRALCFSPNNSYPSINNFMWYSNNDEIVEILPGGYVKAKDVSEITNVTITGQCIYNNNIVASIQFTLIPNE